MSSASLQECNFRWEKLLDLGEQLVNQPSITARSTLIEQMGADLLHAQTELWLAEHAYRLPGTQESSQFSDKPSSELMQAALESGKICTEPSELTDNSRNPTTVAVPLSAQDLILGVLGFKRLDGPGFDQEDLQFINSLAAHVAFSLKVQQQSVIKSWRLEQLTLVRSVSAQIANITDLDELALQVTTLIRDAFKYSYVGIFTAEPGSQILSYRASSHISPTIENDKVLHHLQIHFGEGIVGSVAEKGEPIIAQHVEVEPRYRYIDGLPETKAEAALPLLVENRVLGVLDVQSDREEAFHENDILVLHALADNIALAIEGARLYNDLHRRAEQLTVISEVSRAITSILDQEDLLNEVVNLIQQHLGYSYVHIFTVHPGRQLVIYQAGSGGRSTQLQRGELSYSLNDPLGIIPWVARNGKTITANDVDLEPLYRPSDLPPQNTRAELAVPLVFAGEVYGILDIQSDQPNVFGNEERFLLEALADNISIALRNARLYRTEQWRRQAAESLRDVAGLLSSEMALEDVLNAILTELDRILPCDITAIWLLEEDPIASPEDDHKRLHLAGIHGGEEISVEQIGHLSPHSEEFLSRAMQDDKPIIRSAQDPLGPLGIALGFWQDYSSIVAPLRVGEQVLGVLALAHHLPGRYGSESISLTTAFASYAAIAIQNNRLYATSQEQAWVSTVMLQVAEAMQSLHNLDELLDTVVRLTPMLVGVKSCAIFNYNSTGNLFSLSAIYGMEPQQEIFLNNHLFHPNNHEYFGKLLEERLPVPVPEGLFTLALPFEEILTSEENNPIVLFPILARDEILGAFLIEQHGHQWGISIQGAFNDQRLAILQGIVQQTAVAVENIRLLEGKQEEAYVSAVLLQVAQAVVSLNELDDILESIVNIMPILVGIDTCILYLWDPERNIYQPRHIYDETWEAIADLYSTVYTRGDFPILDAIREKDRLIICPLGSPPEAPDAWQTISLPENDLDGKEYLNHQGNLLIGVPLSIKGDFFGVLLAKDSRTGGEFRNRRLEIINGIAQQAALAIQTNHLNREMLGRERLEREFQLAREIQRTFLPSYLPEHPDWELDVRWRPARQVGGDFYDCFELPDNRIGLVIADVSDKGMPAALYMTVTRTLVRAAALEEESPAAVLEQVNNLLLMDSRSGMFVTGVYAVVSLDSREVTYANAGHNLPLLQRDGGQVIERLTKGGTAMGAWEDIQLVDHKISLNPGDMLLLYTDGVTETFDIHGEIFGENRLIETMQQAKAQSAAQLLEAIEAKLENYIGDAPPSDDITLLAIYRNHSPQSD